MKRILLSLVAIATISLSSFGQAPEGFKYQAVVRDAGNTILNNQVVGMRMTIQQGSIGGTTVYQETFLPTTNAYGLVNLEIGNGTAVSGDFTTIDWSAGPYFIETAVDVTGGTSYAVMGTSQLMSVPYALHASTAENVTNDQINDADADPTNEMNTGVVLNGTDLEVTDGNGTIITDLSSLQDGVNDADADPTNELQALSLSNDTLYLSNGNNVYMGNIGSGSGNTRFEIFEISGTFTVPLGVDQLIVEVWGAGGGGARFDGVGNGGGAGGGGGYGKDFIDVIPGTPYTVTIGTGGAGATANSSPGLDGGSSDFGGILVATGGKGSALIYGGQGGTSTARIKEDGTAGTNGANCGGGSSGLAGGMANTVGKGGRGTNGTTCSINPVAGSGTDGMIIVIW
ncbi:hypothetical protein OAK35_03390 [Crocinitomicaceae bacterium]|nr:hypothetical protein [Crocinitomicaceae bacterium]